MCQNRPQRHYKLHLLCYKCGHTKKTNSRICPETNKCEHCHSDMMPVSYDFEAPRKGSAKHKRMLNLFKKGFKIQPVHGCGCNSNRKNAQPKKWTATSAKQNKQVWQKNGKQKPKLVYEK